MKWYVLDDLHNFPFFGRSQENAEKLTDEQLDAFGECLARMFGEMEDERIYEIFSNEFDWVCDTLGIPSDPALEKHRKEAGDSIRKEIRERFRHWNGDRSIPPVTDCDFVSVSEENGFKAEFLICDEGDVPDGACPLSDFMDIGFRRIREEELQAYLEERICR